MKKLILCSSNPLLVKSLYAMLREQGYTVENVEHPSLAVQKVLAGTYDLLILDAEPFGLSAEDAARIITTIAPGMPILCMGAAAAGDAFPMIRVPADPDAIKEMLQHMAA